NCVISYTPSTLGAFSATFRIATNDAYESDKILETVGAAKLTKKYSEFPVGRGPSLLGSGPDDDYATLAAAAADFNSVMGGSTGDWNVFITSDLTEPVNVAFGNATNGHKVTIRPRAGVSPLIDFTQTSTPVLGHWIIGATDHNDRASLVKTDNFIINGWSDDIGTTRGLTIRNRDSEIFNSRVILVYGDCDNFTIRNCNVINRSRSITDNGCTVVEFMSRNFDWVNNYIPDNGTVENCSISAVGPDAGSAKFGTGIKQSALGTITGKRAQADLTVKDCDINVRYTGVYLGQTAGAMIHDNTIRIDQPTPGTHIRAIWLNSANGSSGWTMDIFNNTIDQLNNFDTGISAIDLGNANYVGMHDPIMINVHNNMICGFNFTTPLLRSNVAYRGIYYDGGSTYDFTISFNCYFNSIYMPHFPKLSYTPGNTTSQRSAFAIGAPANYYGRVFDVRNNILRVEQKYAAAIHYMKYLNNTIVTCDYNNLSVDTANGAFTGRFSNLLVMTEYPSFADWQSAPDSPDQHSITMNPFDVYPPYTGNWTATNNLLFTSFPTTAMLGTSIPGITTDILGTARNAAVPFMGCHEPKASGPQMVLQPDSLDFGRCLVLAEDGSAITENIIISNLGIMDLVTSAVTFLGGSPDFSLISYEPNIASGASGLFTIRYTPVALGPQTATFRIHSNDPIVPVRDVVVQGVGRLTKMFSALPVGRGNSWVGNDPEADYQTLAEAAADFNAVAGGCTGDWNLWIITDLTEPDNVAFGNTIPVPFKVTIRPLAGVAPVVTFTQSGVGEVPGHLIIGAADSGDLDSLVKTDRFIINGCSDDAFSTKSLVIQNRDDAAIADSSLVLVAGDSDNAVIRNCILLNRSLSNAENGCTAVDFMSRNDGMNNFIPDNATIENCTITAQGGSGATGRYGTAVRQSGSGTITQGLAQTGLVVRDCAINARYAGILLGMTAGASIHDNTIQLNQLASGTHIRGIWLTSANRSSGWTLDIFNNTINRMVCVDTGITAIDLGSAVYTSAHTPITMNVYNNMICGFNFTATASVSNVIYRGVFYDGGSEFVAPIYFNCWFNSLYMPHFANLTYTPGTEAGRRAAFAIGAPAGQSYRILDIRDNIIRLEQNYAAAIHYMNYLDKTFTTCDYNDLSVDGTSGAFTGRYADASSITEYASLADWQGASGAPDEHSVSVNPFIATPPFTGTWTATDNLLFTSYNSTLLA
ncbi:MAG TPA: hypothetical protein PLB62_07515, partial [Candidatus Sumerlaeota bacterium]|nr:hypothetical protein [Candidatus Sumerlaeota bacterium]